MIPVLACLVGLVAAQADVKIVAEWVFNASGDARGWTWGGDMVSAEATDDGLRLVSATPDPMAFGPEFKLAASPLQAVEISYTCSAEGEGELFWAHDRTPPYGGIHPENRRVLAFEACAQPRVLRCWPFWHGKPDVIRIRIDPPPNVTLIIKSVRVVEVQASSETWDGASSQPEAVLVPLEDARLDDGTIVATGPRALLASLRIPAGDKALGWLGLVPGEGAAECEFQAGIALEGRSGLQWGSAAFRPPAPCNARLVGAERLRERSGWLLLSLPEGVSLPLRELSITEAPIGPPAPQVVWFGAEEAIARAGMTEPILLRLSARNSPPLTGLTAWLDLPRGVSLLSDSPRSDAPGEIDTDDCGDVRWEVRAETAGTYTLRARVLGDGVRLDVEAPVEFTEPPGGVAPLRVPEPVPLASDYDIGVYYFPGWNRYSAWQVLDMFPERCPVLGYYREGDTEVIDWQLLWAAERGIRFFAYDWYWSEGVRQLEHGIQAYLRAQNRRYVDFCLLWANHNPPGTSSRADLLAVTQFWIDNYFREPGYYHVEGRPLVIIFSPDRIEQDMGAEAVSEAFAAMRELCESQGVPPVYLAACAFPGSYVGDHLAAMGYDAVTGYCWPHLGAAGRQRAPYADLLAPHAEAWRSVADAGPLTLIPPVSGGWDSRPWHGEQALVRTDRTPELFEQHLRDVKAFLDDGGCAAGKIAIIEAWNEWGEGSYIEPHRQYGFGYVDAIARVFGRDFEARPPVLPKDVGLGPYSIPSPQPRSKWDMDGPQDGWAAGVGIADLRWEDGCLVFRTHGSDPVLSGPGVSLPAREIAELRVRMASDLDGLAQLFWGTRSIPISEWTSVSFHVTGDGQMREYVVPLATVAAWQGRIRTLRFDPIHGGEANIRIDAIEFVAK